MATSPTPTAHQALFIAEITEMIFLHMRRIEILVNVQRTCRFFKQVIEGSPKLQQALFFKPIGPALVFDRAIDAFRHPQTGNVIFPRDHYLLTRHLDFLKPIHDPDASWRRQLCSQPPLASIQCPVRGKVMLVGEGITVLESQQLAPHSGQSLDPDFKVRYFAGWRNGVLSGWNTSSQTAQEFLAQVWQDLEEDDDENNEDEGDEEEDEEDEKDKEAKEQE